MRTRCCVLLAICAVSLLGSAAPSGAGRATCRPPYTTTLTGSGELRVYLKVYGVYACRYRDGRTRRLGHFGYSGYVVSAVAAAGGYVAWTSQEPAESSQGPYSPDQLMLWNLTGRPKHVAVGCESPPAAGDGYVGLQVLGFDLSASGLLAWTCRTTSFGQGYTEVHARLAGKRILLDSDAASADDPIDPLSVSISPHTSNGDSNRVSWMRASRRAVRRPIALSARDGYGDELSEPV